MCIPASVYSVGSISVALSGSPLHDSLFGKSGSVKTFLLNFLRLKPVSLKYKELGKLKWSSHVNVTTQRLVFLFLTGLQSRLLYDSDHDKTNKVG